jgi:hypothetical protein
MANSIMPKRHPCHKVRRQVAQFSHRCPRAPATANAPTPAAIDHATAQKTLNSLAAVIGVFSFP